MPRGDGGDERRDLHREVMTALGDMVKRTCASMRPLWLEHSLPARRALVQAPLPLPTDYPAHLLVMTKTTRCKYRWLAGWRHCVIWQQLLEAAAEIDRAGSEATRRIYFTHYPDDKPPFSFAQRTSALPDLAPGETSKQLRSAAQVACFWTVTELWRRHAASGRHERAFLELGGGNTLREVLKLEDLWPGRWTPGPDEDWVPE